MKLNSKENIVKGVFWRLLERFGAQTVSFVVSVILARLLDPEVYGLIALVIVFTSIMQVFVDSGFGNALIQKKEVDDLDYSSVFYFNIAFCLLLYACMYLAAPAIAHFYNTPELTAVLRVLSLIIIISGVKNVQQAYIARNMKFKIFFFATLGGTIGASIIGILMAYNGYGVWALVAQYLFNATTDTCILWVMVKWRPKAQFSFERLKVLFSYGWKLFVPSLIDAIYEDLRSIVIGKMYSANDLAFYNRGKILPQLCVSNVNSAVESVLFPAMSMEQDNIAKVRTMTSRAIKTLSYVIIPIMVGLAVCSKPIVIILFTAKWEESIPYMRIFCLALAIVPITLANLNAIKAIGRSDVFLKLEIIRKFFNTISILSLMWFGVKAIACSYLLNCIMNLVINSSQNKKLLNYSFGNQLLDMAPAVLLSTTMGIVLVLISMLDYSDWATLLIQVPIGILIYIGGSYVFKVESLQYTLSILKAFHLNSSRNRNVAV